MVFANNKKKKSDSVKSLFSNSINYNLKNIWTSLTTDHRNICNNRATNIVYMLIYINLLVLL